MFHRRLLNGSLNFLKYTYTSELVLNFFENPGYIYIYISEGYLNGSLKKIKYTYTSEFVLNFF
jgi:hypothetical protein